MVLIYTVYNVSLWLNPFLLQSGITGRFSTRELVTGLTFTFYKHCTVNVGAYVESSTYPIITNSNNDKTDACIALGSSGNRQGYVNRFGIVMCRVVVRRTVKQMIWPDRLLRKANARGKKVKNGNLKGPNQVSEPNRGEI